MSALHAKTVEAGEEGKEILAARVAEKKEAQLNPGERSPTPLYAKPTEASSRRAAATVEEQVRVSFDGPHRHTSPLPPCQPTGP